MSAKTNSIRIGIFVLVGIFLFIAGLLAFGARSYFVRKITYETAIAGDVSGLSVGSRVLYRGVPIGKVSDIEFAQNLHPESHSDMIIVEFEVDLTIFTSTKTPEAKKQRLQQEVAKGLRAMVKGQGITGTSVLAVERLNPEDHPPPFIDYVPRYPYVPSTPGQFTRMLESIEQSLRNLRELDLQGLGLGLSNTLARVTRLLDKLNGLDLKKTVGKADSVLDRFNAAVGNVDATVKSMKLDTLSGNADELLAGLKETSTKLQTVLDHLGAVPLQDTVGEIHSAAQKLDEVLIELKRYPSGFIFGKPPPPAKSVQPPPR